MARLKPGEYFYMGVKVREVVVDKDSCDGCYFKPPLNEVCHVNIWANNRSHTKVVCGVKPVIFKEVDEEDDDG